MPRYVVERTFPDGLQIAVAEGGAEVCGSVVDRNADEGVTWVHSYVSEDKTQDVLRLRRAQPGGDPQDREAQRPAGRPDHAGAAYSIPTSTHEG